MKQRIITAAIGLCVLALVLAFYNTVVFNIAVIVLIVLSIYELFTAANLVRYKLLFALCLLSSALVPFLQTKTSTLPLVIICGVLYLVLFLYYNLLRVEQISLVFIFSLFVPFSFSTLQLVHDRYPMSVSMLYLLLMLGGAWLTDTGAYFVGNLMGKHKLAPKISPKKTIEGAVGGVAFNLIAFFGIVWLYSFGAKQMFDITITTNYVALAVLALISSVVAIFGDLAASVVKRQHGIKDFGSIMPGHGGVMDRFDSVLFVAPTVYIFIRYINLVTLM